MLTVKDIDSRMFEQAKPGYKPEEVDEFLKEISESFKALQDELAEKDKKMSFLVETVKKYKEEEEDLKGALILAQKQSREVIAAAQEKAEQIIAEANVKSDADFRSNLLNMYREHLSLINNIPELDEEEDEEIAEETFSEKNEDTAPVITE